MLAVARSAEPAATPATPLAGRPGEAVHTVESIDFSGNTRLSSAQLAQFVGLKVGDAFTREVIDAATDRIVAAYRAQGSNLSVMVDFGQPDATHIALRFLIDEQGTGGNLSTAPRGGRMGIPPVPPPATRQ